MTHRLHDTSLHVTLEPPWLIVQFEAPQVVCSWAAVGGGIAQARHVAWRQVRDADLGPRVDPAVFLTSQLEGRRLVGAVGLLTSADITRFATSTEQRSGVAARCLATVGLGNARRAGDPTDAPQSSDSSPLECSPVGTINLLCHVSVPLSQQALLEALALCAEARTLAVSEAGVQSGLSGAPASGTGTDCVVVACPSGSLREPYAGKHTALGGVIGASVLGAVRSGVHDWLERHGKLVGPSGGAQTKGAQP